MGNIKCRLQGPAWYARKSNMKMVSYETSLRGNIKGIYIDVTTGDKYSHWLSNKEKEEFLKVGKGMKVVKIDYNPHKVSSLDDVCDFETNYISDITITWDDGVMVQFFVDSKHNIMSEADWMVLLANTNSRNEVKDAVIKKYSKVINEYGINIAIRETKVNLD